MTINSKGPGGGSITAFLATVVLKNVITSVKVQGKIQFGVLALLPFGSSNFLDLFAINEDVSTSTEVSRGIELEGGLVIGDWEYNSVVVTKVGLDF
jgi:hypothetical protein